MEADLARCPDAQESDSEETAAALATAEQAQQQHLASVRTGDRLAATQLEVFFARRPGAQDSDSDGEETAAALAAAQRARQQRRADERTGDRLVARLAALAASASASGRWMEAIELCTRALAERPNDTELLAQRASACARAGHYAAALHDGELMVRLTPDWYRGFQVRCHADCTFLATPHQPARAPHASNASTHRVCGCGGGVGGWRSGGLDSRGHTT